MFPHTYTVRVFFVFWNYVFVWLLWRLQNSILFPSPKLLPIQLLFLFYFIPFKLSHNLSIPAPFFCFSILLLLFFSVQTFVFFFILNTPVWRTGRKIAYASRVFFSFRLASLENILTILFVCFVVVFSNVLVVIVQLNDWITVPNGSFTSVECVPPTEK